MLLCKQVLDNSGRKAMSKNIMGMPVLILNGDYQPLTKYPLSLNTVRKVIKSLLKGRVSIVKEYDETISLGNEVIHLPKIVVLKKYINVSHTPKFSRKNVYLRDNYTCQYCGKRFCADDLTFDHIVPRCHGGKTTWDNIVTACKTCNGKKGGKTLEESHMKLLNQPFIPTMSLLEKNSEKMGIKFYDQWYDELGW